MNKNFFYFNQQTKYSPYWNLALEEAIAINLTSFGFTGALRFWSNHNTIVLGLSDSASNNIPKEKIDEFNKEYPRLQDSRKFKEDSIYIARRASGGGTVFHDETFNLNYSFFVSIKEKKELYPVKESYQILLGLISKALEKQNIHAELAGKSDLALEREGILKKISGNAQFRKRDCIVQHGTLLLDLKIIERVLENLSHPPEEPEYRKKRMHSDFLSSLPKEFSVAQFKQDLQELFKDFLGVPSVISSIREKSSSVLKAGILQDSFKNRPLTMFEVTGDENRKFLRQVFRDAKRLMSEKYANIEFIFSKP